MALRCQREDRNLPCALDRWKPAIAKASHCLPSIKSLYFLYWLGLLVECTCNHMERQCKNPETSLLSQPAKGARLWRRSWLGDARQATTYATEYASCFVWSMVCILYSMYGFFR